MARKPAILVYFSLCRVIKRALLWGGVCLAMVQGKEEKGGKGGRAGETGSGESLIVRVLNCSSLPWSESSSAHLSGQL